MTAADGAPVVAIAAGGTGGHVFPAQALAAELRGRGLRLALITDRRGDAFTDAEVYRVASAGLAGRSSVARLRGAGALAVGVVQAVRLLRRLAPAAVTGFGGYASVPAVVAASLIGRPTVIHEQNAVLGRANRLLASRVDRITTGFERVERCPPPSLSKLICVGTPIRPAFDGVIAAPYPGRAADAPFRVLVLGGSQGARVFSELVPAAVAMLPEAARRRLHIAQQCRSEDLDAARAAFAAAGTAAELAAFFGDVPERLAASHLVICRAGASTVSEVTAVGRPAILVPYPHAIDDHQTGNAHAVADSGGGWLAPQAELTPAVLAERLGVLMNEPETLQTAAAAAAGVGRPDAAANLADVVCGLIDADVGAGRMAA